MKNKNCFWLLFLPGLVVLIRLIFTAAFWSFIGYAIGYTLFFGMVAFFVYVAFIRMFIVRNK